MLGSVVARWRNVGPILISGVAAGAVTLASASLWCCC